MTDVRTVGKKINELGGAFMLHQDTMERASTVGLDGLAFYALGRFGVLGNVDSDVVASAAFFFEPGAVAAIWDGAREKADPHKTALAYAEACADWGRARLGEVEGLERFNELAGRVVRGADGRGLALFCGWRQLPLPDDEPGRAMQLACVLRELRGGCNGLATRVVGLAPAEAVVVNSGEGMARMMGWQDLPDPEPLRAKVDEAEDLTDRLVTPAFSVLDEAERTELASIVDTAHAAAGLG